MMDSYSNGSTDDFGYDNSISLREFQVEPGEMMHSESWLGMQQANGQNHFWESGVINFGKDVEGGNLVLKVGPDRNTGFLLLMRIADRIAKVYEPGTITLDELPAAEYQLWRYTRDGRYEKARPFNIESQKTLLLRVSPSDFEAAHRPEKLFFLSEEPLSLNYYEKKFSQVHREYQEFLILDGMTGKPYRNGIVTISPVYGSHIYHTNDSGKVVIEFQKEGIYRIGFGADDRRERTWSRVEWFGRPGLGNPER